MSDPEYVTAQELLALHAHAIERYGGAPGVRDWGALESSLAQPAMRVFDYERFASLHEKAAAYCFFIVRNHPFADGNKRAGFLAGLHFLLKNGVVPFFDEDETLRMIAAVAAGSTGLKELTGLFEWATAPDLRRHDGQQA